MTKSRSLGLTALALALAGTAGLAQIRSLTLTEMVDVADNAVHGTIVNARSFRVDHPVDGPELYFTTLTIEGRSLTDGSPITVDVTFHGGFVSETEGVYNSEAPSKDDIAIGNSVVAFYGWKDNMGGDVAGNALVAAHGGLYRTVSGPSDATVLGRGAGYAVDRNVRVNTLDSAVTRLHEAKLLRLREGR